jgi:hypothetical protein
MLTGSPAPNPVPVTTIVLPADCSAGLKDIFGDWAFAMGAIAAEAKTPKITIVIIRLTVRFFKIPLPATMGYLVYLTIAYLTLCEMRHQRQNMAS